MYDKVQINIAQVYISYILKKKFKKCSEKYSFRHTFGYRILWPVEWEWYFGQGHNCLHSVKTAPMQFAKA